MIVPARDTAPLPKDLAEPREARGDVVGNVLAVALGLVALATLIVGLSVIA